MVGQAHSFMKKQAEISFFDDLPMLSREAAQQFTLLAREHINRKGFFSVVLSGGSTPIPFYRKLTENMLSEADWQRVLFFWGDERCVPPDHQESNFKMAFDTMLSNLPISNKQIYRMQGELAPEDGARAYEETLNTCSSIWSPEATMPQFDLVLLGIGNDGHTASLFPKSPALQQTQRFVAHTPPPTAQPKVARLTLTYPVLNNAREVWFLAAGQQKRAIMEATLMGEEGYPATRIQPVGTLRWFLASTTGL